MGYRADEVKVGFVLVLSLLILGGFILVILGLRIGQPMVTYSTSLKFVAGIDPGRPVRFGGMQVGKVVDVSVSSEDNSFIEVKMEIEKGVPVKTDSIAFINAIGFVGDYYMEISTGTTDAPLLPPGSRIAGRDAATFTEMLAKAESAIEKVDASLGIINDQILAEQLPELRERLSRTSENLDRLLNDLDAIILENRANISRAINQIGDLIAENRQEVRDMIANFREAAAKLNELADSLNSTVADNREEIDTIVSTLRAAAAEAEAAATKVDAIVSQNADDITAAVENLHSTSANFRDLSESLSSQPWRLLWRTRPPERQQINRE